MNKKVLSGVIFGLSLGLCIGITTPMIGATSKAKDIVIKKNTFKANAISAPVTEKPATDENKDIKEAVTILKEINSKLKENSEQNKEIINSIKVLISRTALNPMADEKK